MIHIATIHWKTDKWIEIQLRYLKKSLKTKFRLYAFLNEINIQPYKKYFYYLSSENIIQHEKKLNILSDVILSSTRNEKDIIIFLDGDAFPITPLKTVLSYLESYPLVAIQRRENYLEKDLPHPSFCFSTIGFWKNIRGNWNRRYIGKYLGEKHFEVGGELGERLHDLKLKWYPLLRTHSLGKHPLWYGIYENTIYHHGAGFRKPFSRIDKTMLNTFQKTYYFFSIKMPSPIRRFLDPYQIIYKKEISISEQIFLQIKNNPDFFNQNIINTNNKLNHI